jgi:hypothetical protein
MDLIINSIDDNSIIGCDFRLNIEQKKMSNIHGTFPASIRAESLLMMISFSVEDLIPNMNV